MRLAIGLYLSHIFRIGEIIALRRFVAALPVFVFMITACDIFIKKAEIDVLKEKEKKIYILKKDIDIEGKKLKKGEPVRIVIVPGKEWIKVLAYPAKVNDLKAERLLILYLFDDNFQQKKFDMNAFDEQLNTVVGAGAPALFPDKKIRNK
jgi:type II secretion system-associated lipoprotein